MKYRFFIRSFYPDDKIGMSFTEEINYLCSDCKEWTSNKKNAGIFSLQDWYGWGQYIKDLEHEVVGLDGFVRAIFDPELPL